MPELPTTTATESAGVVLTGIRQQYGKVPVLMGVDLAAPAGAITALVGPSGCGKSTVLRVIAGLEPTTAGTLSVGGTAIIDGTTQTPAQRRRVGLVFQDDALFPHKRAWQNVAVGLRHLPRAERRQRAEAWLERCGVGDLATRWPHTCSGGQRARIALARALAPEPRALLLDEPFAGLDPDLRASVREEVLAIIRSTGTTCLLVTHDPEEALAVADHLVLLRAGQVVQAGTPSAVYRQPIDLATMAFFGPISQLPCTINKATATSVFGDCPAPGIENGPAILAVRERGLTPGQDGVAARCHASQLLGSERRSKLELSDGSHVRARHRDHGDPCAIVDLRVALDPELCVVFAQPAD